MSKPIEVPTLSINLDAKCIRCKRGGATPSGYCMGCINKRLKEGKYDAVLAPLKERVGSAIKESLQGSGKDNMSEKPKSIMKRLPVPLTDQEKLDRGRSLANKLDEHDAIEAEFTSVKQTYKGKLETAQSEIGSLQRIVAEGREYREVECVIYEDYVNLRVSTVRTDTNEEIEGRPMNMEERQRLPFEVEQQAG